MISDADEPTTAMMVMGLEKAKAFAEKEKYVDAFFIFANEQFLYNLVSQFLLVAV